MRSSKSYLLAICLLRKSKGMAELVTASYQVKELEEQLTETLENTRSNQAEANEDTK